MPDGADVAVVVAVAVSVAVDVEERDVVAVDVNDRVDVAERVMERLADTDLELLFDGLAGREGLPRTNDDAVDVVVDVGTAVEVEVELDVDDAVAVAVSSPPTVSCACTVRMSATTTSRAPTVVKPEAARDARMVGKFVYPHWPSSDHAPAATTPLSLLTHENKQRNALPTPRSTPSRRMRRSCCGMSCLSTPPNTRGCQRRPRPRATTLTPSPHIHHSTPNCAIATTWQLRGW